MELIRAEVAKKLSEINRRKVISAETKDFIVRRINESILKGHTEIVVDFKDNDLSWKIVNWVSEYGYRAYFDANDYLHITWH